MATKRKVISRDADARARFMRGADLIGDSVRATLGPFGSNWLLEKDGKVTNDGKKIAAELEGADEIEHLGLKAVREAANKTDAEVGDGTTTAITLSQAILKVAVKTQGDGKTIGSKLPPSSLIRQIESERKEITEKLVAMATPITTIEQLINSARVSVEDDVLGEMIGSMQWELGEEGVIIVEQSNERTSTIKQVSGVRIDNGLGTALLMNNLEKQLLELEDARVIITNHTIETIQPLVKLLESLWKAGSKKVVLVARAFTNEAVQECLKNIQGGGISIYPINAPYTNSNEVMQDMAALLGGNCVLYDAKGLEDIQLSDVGYVKKLISRRYTSIFTGGDDDKTKERIAKRIEELKDMLKGSESEFEKKQLQLRLSQLQNGFAILEVGATSDVERERLVDKCEDAVNAVRCAFQEGTVPGAGLAFKMISDELPETYLLKNPILSINQQIMSTAPEGFVVEDWVRDPVKVLRIGLEKACSVAGALATAAGGVATERDKPLDLMLRGNKE